MLEDEVKVGVKDVFSTVNFRDVSVVSNRVGTDFCRGTGKIKLPVCLEIVEEVDVTISTGETRDMTSCKATIVFIDNYFSGFIVLREDLTLFQNVYFDCLAKTDFDVVFRKDLGLVVVAIITFVLTKNFLDVEGGFTDASTNDVTSLVREALTQTLVSFTTTFKVCFDVLVDLTILDGSGRNGKVIDIIDEHEIVAEKGVVIYKGLANF